MMKTLLSMQRATKILRITMELLPYFRRVIAAADRLIDLSGSERRQLVVACLQSVEEQLVSVSRKDFEAEGERITGTAEETITRTPGAFEWGGPTGDDS